MPNTLHTNKAKKFAVFDIDGTLIRWQLYHAVVDNLAKQGLLGDNAVEKLHEARMRWKRREHPEAFRTYELELITMYEAAVTGIGTAQFDKAVKAVANEYNTQTYTYTRDLITQLKKDGYVLFAISGSHTELVEHIAHHYGFDDWVGSTYERTDGTFTGKSFVASHDKKAILQDLIKKHSVTLAASVAVGDSKSDAVMLKMVEQPIAFNPDRALLQIAQQHGWDIVVERKNVIYKLEQRDGRYILA